jgi:catechol 2,3-dioxygenase-like lactoylglutathione lyase family enzyme
MDGSERARQSRQPASPAPQLVSTPVRLRHTGLTVTSIERSLAFYRDGLGMVVVAQQEGRRPYLATITGFADVYLKFAYLKVSPESEHILELLEYQSHPARAVRIQPNHPGSAHLCLEVTDIQEYYRQLTAAGTAFISPPVSITTGLNEGALACYLRDPDGFIVELFQAPAAS